MKKDPWHGTLLIVAKVAQNFISCDQSNILWANNVFHPPRGVYIPIVGFIYRAHVQCAHALSTE